MKYNYFVKVTTHLGVFEGLLFSINHSKSLTEDLFFRHIISEHSKNEQLHIYSNGIRHTIPANVKNNSIISTNLCEFPD